MPLALGIFLGYSFLIRAIGHIASGEPVMPREGQKWSDNIVVETVRYLIRDGGLVLFFFIVSIQLAVAEFVQANFQYGDRVPSIN